MINGIKIWTIKDNYRLGDGIQAKILAFAFGLSAEIERDLISQRTKEALARKKSEGFVLGRPSGRKPALQKLSIHEAMKRKFRRCWPKMPPKPPLSASSACTGRRCIHT
jgi:DNA invertase Pin-like site-specific DNA recombinase